MVKDLVALKLASLKKNVGDRTRVITFGLHRDGVNFSFYSWVCYLSTSLIFSIQIGLSREVVLLRISTAVSCCGNQE